VRRRQKKPRFFVLLIAVTVLAFGCSCIATLSSIRDGEARLEGLLAERAQLMEDADLLREEIAFAQTKAYVERVARSELGMIMPGEVSYVNSNNAG